MDQRGSVFHGIEVNFKEEGSKLYLFSKVRELSQKQATKALLGSLLEANANTTYFAWDKKTSSLFLVVVLENKNDLEGQVDAFARVVEQWQKKLLTFDGHEGEELLDFLSQKKQVFFS